ncbi:MAG: bifunctional nuclease family protein [Candidatus Sungbacteria bacterium]|nr:bifunctional nuclease family protein [Candidatus Sungbacteria bacterium]
MFQEGPCVLLEDTEGRGIWMPVFIGRSEFDYIIWALNGFAPPRPVIHDLFKTVVEKLGGAVEKVLVTKLENNTFFSELHLRKPDGSVVQIDSRTSDAIALALRFGCPILVEEEVVNNLLEVSVTETKTGVTLAYNSQAPGNLDLESLPMHDKDAMKKYFKQIGNKSPDKDKLS